MASFVFYLFRVIVGAPRGTFPGGLTLEDYGLPAINRSGLIYSCPLGPGICEGVTGDRTLYDDNVDSNITNGVQLNVNEFDFFFSAPISEGRLFDQARKCTHIFLITGYYCVVGLVWSVTPYYLALLALEHSCVDLSYLIGGYKAA